MGVMRVARASGAADAPARGPGAAPGAPPRRLVGAPLPRREDERILRGRARYLDDLELPRQLHAAFVRSVHARARITAIRPPEAADGLVAVFTAADLGARVRPFPVQVPEGAEVADLGHPVLAAEEVRYAGQPVALVVAESRALAEDAAELVEVDYEVLDAVVDPAAAHERLMTWARSAGDPDAAFARAANVVRREYGLPRMVAAPMETRGAIAAHDAGTGALTIWCSAQDPHRPLAQLAHVLQRPDDTIRIVVPDVGGAFGSKGVVGAEVAAIAVAAMDLARPVKWAEDRLENFMAAYQGRGMRGEVELAFDKDARLLAIRARLLADLGAYLYTTTALPPHTAAMLMCGVYDVEAADVEVVGARTDKVPTGPCRGAGRPEAAYFAERAMDDAARALGLSPAELRRRNLIRSWPHETPLGFTYDSGDYERCLDLALELAGQAPEPTPGALRGRGLALYVERAGGQWESADVTVEPSGRVVIRSGSSPHGQGHETTFAQIAADSLGVPPEDIVLRFGDTAEVPRGVGSFASRSVAMGGSAIVRAAEELLERARPVAARLLEADEVTWGDGRFIAPGGGSVTLREVATAATGLRAAARFSSPQVFSSGAYVATVEIDPATGILRVVHLAAVDDGGTVINPLLAHGQALGGIAQGLGEVLAEEAVHDEGGQLRTASFADYSLLTAAEMPPLAIGVVETPSPHNPLGAKGLGEGGAIGTLPAVANAVADALGGRHVDPPYTEEKLWRALEEAVR
jgi:aerobic carbon-monoxide dehydrogenase large subunit